MRTNYVLVSELTVSHGHRVCCYALAVACKVKQAPGRHNVPFEMEVRKARPPYPRHADAHLVLGVVDIEVAHLDRPCSEWVIADFRFATGQHSDQRGLANIRCSYKRNLQFLAGTSASVEHLPCNERAVQSPLNCGKQA